MKHEVCRWAYKIKNGEVVGHVRRYEEAAPGSTQPRKVVLPYFKPDGQSGLPDNMPATHRIYGLDTVKNLNEPVYIVEGEKCAHALHGLGLQAVTSLGGAGNGHLAAWAELSGCQHILLLPDNDGPGFKYMEGIYRSLRKLPSTQQPTIQLVQFTVPEKGDVCDVLARMSELHDWNQLDSLAEHPQRNEIRRKLLLLIADLTADIPVEWKYIVSRSGLRALSWADFSRLKLPERRVLLSPWLMEKSINMIFADRGIGKTFYALSSAVALANGSSFLKYQAAEPVPVLYLDGEMQAELMQQRLKDLTNGQNTCAPLSIVTPDCQTIDGMPDLGLLEGQQEIDEIIRQTNPKVIFIDNLSTFVRSGKENEGESWAPIQTWAIKHRSEGRALVFIHHANKEGKQRGSHRKEDVMDVVIQLRRPDDYIGGKEGARFVVSFTKARSLYGADQQDIEALLEEREGLTNWTWKPADGAYGQALMLLKDGISQNEIAEELGVAKGTISKWKRRGQAEGLL